MKTPASAPIPKISSRQLFLYGTGGIIPIALFNIAGQLIGLMGNISLGLSAFWLGTILVIPRLWDAVSDPVVGYFSDHARTPWGRRRPFILVGGLAVAVSFVMMWWIPGGSFVRSIFPGEEAYKWFQLVYILCSLLVFYTATTLFEIPHGALGMELGSDPHERTRLFSAKSFFGNLFAMATPWLFALAGMEFFRGTHGTEIDGMRYVSLLIAAILVPASFIWFFWLREPRSAPLVEAQEKKKGFWADMRHTARNRNFVLLVGVVFTLAMGFNFVGLLNYYISIFYLYAGDKVAAGPLLGINGTVWAVTGLLAVFPLNWLSPRIGKKQTLILAIALMCLAQLSKIFCYNPEQPYLVIIPTILLSAGMLFFFTLGSSMVGDICDEDELHTGTRSEGCYYSVYWWFIKIGTAFASFVMGLLIVFSQFDETHVTKVDALRAQIGGVRAEWNSAPVKEGGEHAALIERAARSAADLQSHFQKKIEMGEVNPAHGEKMATSAALIQKNLLSLRERFGSDASNPGFTGNESEEIENALKNLAQQSPDSLLRMRVIEISLPILLSVFSLLIALKYPLTDQKSREIKEELVKRRSRA